MSDNSSDPKESHDSPPQEVAGPDAPALELRAEEISESPANGNEAQPPNNQQLGPSTSQGQLTAAPADSDEKFSEGRKALLQQILNEPSIRPIRRKPKKSSKTKESSEGEEPTNQDSQLEANVSESASSIDMKKYLEQEHAARRTATAALRGMTGRPDPRIPFREMDHQAGGDHVPHNDSPRMRFLTRFEESRYQRECRAAGRRAPSTPPPSEVQLLDVSNFLQEATREREAYVNWLGNQRQSTSSAAPPQFLEELTETSTWLVPPYTANQPSTSTAPQQPREELNPNPFRWDSPLLDNQPSSSSAVPTTQSTIANQDPTLSDWTVASTPPPTAVLAVDHQSWTSDLTTSRTTSSDSVAQEGGAELATNSDSSTDKRQYRLLLHPPSFTTEPSSSSSSDEDNQHVENPVDEDHQQVENPIDEDHQQVENPSDEDHQQVENPSNEDNQQVGNPSPRPHGEPQEIPVDDAIPPVAEAVSSPDPSAYDASLSEDSVRPPSPKRRRRDSDDSS
ncbi:hypothetical protein CAEBREN_14209 [Caenorhabditis brenneri]|uniref:Uncharacterized protein n=1 Tax=Caenorhabditis brenneri TaxID=135651 RepID=G0MH72_CAEBE|nr:hypothetical protein CAEBREN_14209 [Caenorhabditis brenneri]